MAQSDHEFLLVLTTVSDRESGAALARGLIAARLAACVNLLPAMTSFYEWKGAVEEDAEQQLFIKTRRERLPEVIAWLRENHPYELPEVVAVPIVDGLAGYLEWLNEMTR